MSRSSRSSRLTALLSLLVGLCLSVQAGCRGEEGAAPPPLDRGSEALLRAADEALQQHHFGRAFALVDSLERRDPESADAAFMRGRIYSELARFEEAETSYRASLALRPDYPGAWNNLANNAYRQQQYRQAIERYRRELRVKPAPSPWHGIGLSYLELGQADSARHALREALRIDSLHAPSYFSLGLLEEDAARFEEARRYVGRASEIAPENVHYRYMHGALLVRTERYEEAVGELRRVVEAWPWHHAAHYNLGRALTHLGRTEEGEALIEQSEQLRALDARIRYMEQTVRAVPENPYAHARLASALRMAGRYNDAMHAYQVALHLDPGNVEFLNNVALLHVGRGEDEQALQVFERLLQADSTNAHAWVNVGVLLARRGRTAQAERAWRTALRHDPDHPQAERYLTKLHAEDPR